jgi:hypothetical protein
MVFVSSEETIPVTTTVWFKTPSPDEEVGWEKDSLSAIADPVNTASSEAMSRWSL